MPALAFSLNSSKSKIAPPQAGQKRKKNLFDDDASDGENNGGRLADEEPSRSRGSKAPTSRPTKSLKFDDPPAKSGRDSQNYSNLSALHSARKHKEEANAVDESVYDYDGVYETFHAPKVPPANSAKGSGPKYMSNLLQSAEVRKRDQLRAKERLLQKEREAEGDEFADKEKFVTSAYKKQQEELRKKEEEEAKREVEEEERRRKGGGMQGFYKDLLKKDEERSLQISKAAQEASTMPKDAEPVTEETEAELDESKIAAKLNEKGAHIIVNDDGEVVDKRQLLSAGLNVGKKAKDESRDTSRTGPPSSRPPDFSRSSGPSFEGRSQRERETRMLAAQFEELAELAERQAMEGDEDE